MATRRRPDSNRTTPPGTAGKGPTGSPRTTTAGERNRNSELQAGHKEKPIEDSSTRARDRSGYSGASLVDEQIFPEDRELRIAELAYSKAQQRGFEPGHELDDWLEAEREIDATFSHSEHRPSAL
jgi:hypothetical protein